MEKPKQLAPPCGTGKLAVAICWILLRDPEEKSDTTALLSTFKVHP